MDVKLRPFSESFDRGSRQAPLRIAGKVQGESFVIEVDDFPVRLLTQRIEHDNQGAAAWVPVEQDLAFDLGRLRVLAQLNGTEPFGAEISVQFGAMATVTATGFSVFFNLLGQVDGQGSVRGLSEPPVLN